MIENIKGYDQLIRGSDLQFIIDAINQNEVFGDEQTVFVDKNPSGNLLTAIGSAEAQGGSSTVVSGQPFQLSFDDSTGTPTAKVTGGQIFVNKPNGGQDVYVVEANDADISGFSSTTTIYIYIEIVADWTDGTKFKGYPTLTLGANFGFNDVMYPATDYGKIFHPIGTIDLVVDGQDKTYTVNQSQLDNIYIDPFDITSFKINQLPEAKVDVATPTGNNIMIVNSGQVIMPDNTVVIPTTNQTVLNSSTKYAYLKISATKNGLGYYADFLAVLEFHDSQQANDVENDYIYYLLGSGGASVQQNITTDFISDGRVF